MQQCLCREMPRIKLFLSTKTWPYRCKECKGYVYIEAHLVEAYINSGIVVILAAFVLFALYKALGLLILLIIPVVFRMMELYLFKVTFISEAEKKVREQRRPPSVGALIVLILILLAILFYNYNR